MRCVFSDISCLEISSERVCMACMHISSMHHVQLLPTSCYPAAPHGVHTICACANMYEMPSSSVSMQTLVPPYNNHETMREQNEAPKMAGGSVSGGQRGASALAVDRLHSIVVVIKSRHAQTTTQLHLLQCQGQ